MHPLERWIGVADIERWKRSPWLIAWGRSQARPVPIVLAIAWAFAAGGARMDRSASNADGDVAAALEARGLACDPTDVVWVTRPSGLYRSMMGKGRALVRAHAVDEPSDLYLVEARISPHGDVLAVGDAWNMTATSSAEESRPIVRGHLAAYTTVVEGLYTGLHVLDLDGRPAASGNNFTRVQRAQIALSNLQGTGQSAGIVHNEFAFDPVARSATFSWQDDGLIQVHADDRTVIADPRHASVVSGRAFVRVILDERSRPGNLVTWAVDRLRAVSWFGDDRMQWVKAVAFTALDRWHAQFSRGSTAQDVQDELGLTQATASAPAFTDPEIGWPPPPMKTPVTPPLPGEGRWITLDNDAFITRTQSGAAPAFVTSFLRPNVHRLDLRVYVTLWDPRQIALHVEAGTVEPIGASGEHGPGLVPRTPTVMKHLVAGFNGGFQPQHGEYGLLTNGVEYLPPKPYAATVLELRDGSNAFGAWPSPEAQAEVPDDIVAFRQNLTALVQNGKFNPWGRNWWGGTPPGWPDQVHSTRSAICLTSEGFIGYFYSMSIAADDLAQAMLTTRCAFGIHLDMNPGHAGFEFYNVASDGRLKPLGRPLQNDWESEGRVADMAGYAFRSRRMIRGMGHMLFPRYIQREARDFFYLTARSLLPGAAIDAGPSAEPDEGVWLTRGLPQNGFPYALATTWVRTDARADLMPFKSLKVRVLRADPRTMRPAAGAEAAGTQGSTVLSLTAGARGTESLWWSAGAFTIAVSAPASDATVLAGGVPSTSPLAGNARAAAGVQDEDGMLVWVELAPDARAGASSAAAMDALLERLGCSARMSLPGDARALLGGTLDLSGAPIPPEATLAIGARLVRGHAPDAHMMFDGTPIVPIQVWQPLQAKRVRYIDKPATTASSPSSSFSAEAPPGPEGSAAAIPPSSAGKSGSRLQSRR